MVMFTLLLIIATAFLVNQVYRENQLLITETVILNKKDQQAKIKADVEKAFETFVDKDFPPNNESLFGQNSLKKVPTNIEWLRPAQIAKFSHYGLNEPIRCDDLLLKNTELVDMRRFLSVLAAVAQ